MTGDAVTDDPPGGVIWVRSDVAADGTYVVALETDADSSLVLDRDSALAHAAAVIEVAQRAAYDAAVVAQMNVKLGVPMDAVAQLIGDMRADRPPVDIPGPLDLQPGVSSRRGHEPFLAVRVDGKQVGQWTVADATRHATGVLEAAAVADLDAGYYRTLRGVLELEDGRARNVVDDLVNYRSP